MKNVLAFLFFCVSGVGLSAAYAQSDDLQNTATLASSTTQQEPQGERVEMEVATPENGKARVELTTLPIGTADDIESGQYQLVQSINEIKAGTAVDTVEVFTNDPETGPSAENTTPTNQDEMQSSAESMLPLSASSHLPSHQDSSHDSSVLRRRSKMRGVFDVLLGILYRNHISFQKRGVPTTLGTIGEIERTYPGLRHLFRDRKLKPKGEEVFLGVLKMAWAGYSTAHVFFYTLTGVSMPMAVGMTVLQSVLAFGHTTWARAVDRAFISRVMRDGPEVSELNQFFRRQAYSLFWNEIFKEYLALSVKGMPHIYSLAGQLDVLTYVLLAESGQALISNVRARQFPDNPHVNARFSFLAAMLSLPFYLRELNHSAAKTLIDLHFYSFHYQFTDNSAKMVGVAVGLSLTALLLKPLVSFVLGDTVDLVKKGVLSSVAWVREGLTTHACSLFLNPKTRSLYEAKADHD